MPPRKRSARKAASSASPRSAIATGKSQADEVIEFRRTQRRKRANAIKKRSAGVAREMTQMAMVPTKALAALGPVGSTGVLIAEGDSWFDYPMNDVLRLLEDDHGFDVESVAHKGDRVEDMAFSGGQLEEFARRLEKLLRSRKVPKAILLSGGGNDIAGTEFGVLLNHAASPIAGFNEKIVSGVIDERIRTSYITIVSAITAVCKSYLGRPIPILTHGYDYPVPDGRGFAGGFWFLPGPWLEPGFREKGYTDRDINTRMMKQVMDRFNEMLRTAINSAGFGHVTYIDLRGTLSNAASYKRDWANELHPTERGYRLVADKFAKVIAKL